MLVTNFRPRSSSMRARATTLSKDLPSSLVQLRIAVWTGVTRDKTPSGPFHLLSTRMLSNAILLRSSASGESVLVFAQLLLSCRSACGFQQVGVDRQGADALGRGGEDRIRHRRSNDGGRGLAEAAGGLGAFDQMCFDHRRLVDPQRPIGVRSRYQARRKPLLGGEP